MGAPIMNDDRKGILEALAACKLFLGTEKKDIERYLLPYGEMQTVGKDGFFFMKEDVVDKLGVILSGRLTLYHLFEDGKQNIMDVLWPSDIVGLDLAFTRTRRSVYYAQAEADTVVFVFPAGLFTNAGPVPEDMRNSLLLRLLSMISHDNMRKEYHIAILSRSGVRERILTYLIMQSEKRGTRELTIPFDRAGMASFLRVNRSALSHELSEMRKEGLIDFRKNHFIVKVR